MARSSTLRSLTADTRRELEVAAAIAREAVSQLHVDRAIELIRLGDGRVATLRMLEIYIRLHTLTGATGQVVANRVMATLGRHGVRGVNAIGFEASAQEPGTDETSLFHVLRNRLRGRVHDDIRRIVELHTGAAQAALLDLHVAHAREFVTMLSATHSIEAACTIYREFVEVPTSLTGVLYMLVLDRIAVDELPRPIVAARRNSLQLPPHSTDAERQRHDPRKDSRHDGTGRKQRGRQVLDAM
jgi:hypothetical protein